MKTAISMPDELGKSIEDFIKKMQISRSEFFQRAARTYLDKVTAQAITENLNDVYKQAESPEDIAFRKVALKHFRKIQENEEW